jgi:hypothetical protein
MRGATPSIKIYSAPSQSFNIDVSLASCQAPQLVITAGVSLLAR